MGWISTISAAIVLALLVYVIFSFVTQEVLIKDLCEDVGFEKVFMNNECFKIEGGYYISKEVVIHDGKVYWKENE